MLKKGMTVEEIEKELMGKGDFVQIDHLTRFLKEEHDFETRKYISIKLSDVYERRGMFGESAKLYEMIGEFSKTYAEQTKYYVKAAEIYVKAGFYDRADECIKKSLREVTDRQKRDILTSLKNLYISQAQFYENDRRKSNALKIYEKLMTMNLTDGEREEIKQKLLALYEELGKVREYYMLKGGHGRY